MSDLMLIKDKNSEKTRCEEKVIREKIFANNDFSLSTSTLDFPTTAATITDIRHQTRYWEVFSST